MNRKGDSPERSRSASSSSISAGTGSPSRRQTGPAATASSSGAAAAGGGGRNTVTMMVKVYGQGNDSSVSHSFVVGDVPTALSAPIGKLEFDTRTTRLNKIRDWIQYNRSGNILRRTTMFQQALYIMEHLPNYYDRPKLDLTLWRFGYVQKGSENVKLIDPKLEGETVYSMIPEIYNMDLVIVPLSQIPPDFEAGEGAQGTNATSLGANAGSNDSFDVNNAAAARRTGSPSSSHGRRAKTKQLELQHEEEEEEVSEGGAVGLTMAGRLSAAPASSRARTVAPPPMRPPMGSSPIVTRTAAASIVPSFSAATTTTGAGAKATGGGGDSAAGRQMDTTKTL